MPIPLIPPTPAVEPKSLQTLPNISWGNSHPPVENHHRRRRENRKKGFQTLTRKGNPKPAGLAGSSAALDPAELESWAEESGFWTVGGKARDLLVLLKT